MVLMDRTRRREHMIIDNDIRSIWNYIDDLTSADRVRIGMSMDELMERTEAFLDGLKVSHMERDFFKVWALKQFIKTCNVLHMVPRIEKKYDDDEEIEL